MTWTLSEAQEQAYTEAHGREVFLECPGCSSQVVSIVLGEDEIPDEDLICECGERREEL